MVSLECRKATWITGVIIEYYLAAAQAIKNEFGKYNKNCQNIFFLEFRFKQRR